MKQLLTSDEVVLYHYYEHGASDRQIAERTNTATEYVQLWRKANGLPPNNIMRGVPGTFVIEVINGERPVPRPWESG